MAPKPLEPGDPLRLGRFELLGRLGAGGQGVVYLGRGTGPGEERVAVKVLRSSVDPMVLERLGRELDAVHQVQPFVTAGVIEASVEGDLRYIVSEFIDGPSLQERVMASGPLREGELQRLAVGTATALTAIHGAGVVHRDFKPANVLLGPDGPRVVDFGIARLTDASTMTSGLIGTPTYMAPEQLAGARPTSAVDVWAWGVTMIFAATGRSAFGADTVPAVMHRIMYTEPDLTGLPASLAPAVAECLEKDPQRRPSARDLLLRLVDPSVPFPAAARTQPTGPLYPQPPSTEPLPADSVHTDPRRPGPGFPVDSVPGMAGSGMPYAPPGRPPRSRRGLLVGVGSGAVVAALIVTGALLLTHHPATSSAPPGHTPTAGTSTSSQASSSGPASAPASGPTIPAAFAGTWTGTAKMSVIGVSGITLTNPITFTFVAGARTIAETNQSCVNTLTLTSQSGQVLTFSEPQTTQCVAGTVTFTQHGADLAYRWTDNVEQNVGLLHKT